MTERGLAIQYGKLAQPSQATNEVVAWTEHDWRSLLSLLTNGDEKGKARETVSREQWRSISRQLFQADALSLPTSLPTELLVRIIDDISASAVGTEPLCTQTVSACLKALHAVLVAKGSQRQLLLELRQDRLSTLVDLLLRCATCLPRTSSNPRVARETLSPGQHGRREPSSDPIKLRTSHTSLRSFTNEAEDTEDNTDGASDFSSRPESVDPAMLDRKKLSAACRSLRQNSISCLAAVNATRPAPLFAHWPRVLGQGIQASTGALSGVSALSTTPSNLSHLGGESLPVIVRSDPTLSIRLAACHLMEAMFRQALAGGFFPASITEGRSSLSRYADSSLGSRLASLVVEVRNFFVHMLSPSSTNPPNRIPLRTEPHMAPLAIPNSLLAAMLRLTQAFVQATSSARLRRSHTEVLRETILRLSSHTDAEVALAAYSVLAALSPSTSSRNRLHASEAVPAEGGETSTVATILQKVSDSGLDAEATAQAWNTMGTFAGQDASPFIVLQKSLLSALRKSVHADGLVERQACQTFFSIYFASETARKLGSNEVEAYTSLLSQATRDESALVRTEVVGALTAALPLQERLSRGVPFKSLPIVKLLTSLLEDPEATVRAASVRSFGVLLGSRLKPTAQDIATTNDADISEVSRQVLTTVNTDAALLVRLRSSWTLGNLCQFLAQQGGDTTTAHCQGMSQSDEGSTWHYLLGLSHSFLTDDERLQVNAVRSIGLLLSYAPRSWLDTRKSAAITGPIGQIVYSTLKTISEAKSPKLKWNGMNALAVAYANADLRAWAVDSKGSEGRSLAVDICVTLARQLSSPIFKVKLAAIAGLLRTCTAEEAGGLPHLKAVIFPCAQDAHNAIQKQVEEASFKEAQLHGADCKAGLEDLTKHLDALLI